MSQPTAPLATRRGVDPVAICRVGARLVGLEPWLHGEVARRLADKLPVIRLQPRRVLDWGWGAPAGLARLQQAYPAAQVRAAAIGPAPDPAAVAPPWWLPAAWRRRPGAQPLHPEAVPAGSAELVWSNMWLHWQADPEAEIRRWHAALAVDGFLMFATVGPGTLQSLRRLYAERGWPTPHAPFVDMHDLGDMLVAAGFADPVMDQEDLTLTWSSGEAALAELRGLGANVAPERHRGLRTPRWRQTLAEALSQSLSTTARPGPSLNFEIVYGHALRPAPRPRVAARTTVGLDDMRSILRSRPER